MPQEYSVCPLVHIHKLQVPERGFGITFAVVVVDDDYDDDGDDGGDDNDDDDGDGNGDYDDNHDNVDGDDGDDDDGDDDGDGDSNGNDDDDDDDVHCTLYMHIIQCILAQLHCYSFQASLYLLAHIMKVKYDRNLLSFNRGMIM